MRGAGQSSAGIRRPLDGRGVVLGGGAGVTGLAWVGPAGRGALGSLMLPRLVGRLAPSSSGAPAVTGDEGASGGESAAPAPSDSAFADAAAGFAGAGLAGGEGVPVGD